MRLLVVALAASTLVGGCACTEADLAGLPVERDVASVNVDVPAPTDTRVPGGWWVSPSSDGECTSPLAMGISIPCSTMMNVCTDSDQPTNLILPHVYSCTDDSPTWRDVCATRPAVEWPFYAIEPENCASIGIALAP